MTEPADEAHAWFTRMHGPDAARWAPELAAWRARSPENELAYARLLRKWEQSAFVANTGLGKDRDLERASVWHRRPVVRFATVAAGILLVLGSLIGVTLLRPVPAAAVEYASTDGRVRAVTLPNGTRLTLDAGAVVQVEPARRRAKMIKGRARFDVPATTEAFTVDAGGRSAALDDAQLDVCVRGAEIRMIAWRGAADIRRSDEPGPAVRITRGQKLVWLSDRDQPTQQQANPAEIAWPGGMLAFDGTRLADAIEAINRYRGAPIKLASPTLGELRVTGAFRADDPKGFARAVARLFHLSLDQLPDGSIVLEGQKKNVG